MLTIDFISHPSSTLRMRLLLIEHPVFARCKALTRYTTHPPVDQERFSCFYETEARSTWFHTTKSSNGLTAPTNLHPGFLAGSPISFSARTTKTVSQSLVWFVEDLDDACLQCCDYLFSAQLA